MCELIECTISLRICEDYFNVQRQKYYKTSNETAMKPLSFASGGGGKGPFTRRLESRGLSWSLMHKAGVDVLAVPMEPSVAVVGECILNIPKCDT